MDKSKAALRTFLLEKRKEILANRKKQASEDLFHILWPILNLYPHVLSFVSTVDEIDLTKINEALEAENRLILPRVEGDALVPYLVTDMSEQLTLSKWGILEPNPKKAEKFPIENINCILVPGVGFDKEHHRIGYGKGCYDRFLADITHAPTFGIGFKEQLYHDPFPSEEQDIPLSRLFLF